MSAKLLSGWCQDTISGVKLSERGFAREGHINRGINAVVSKAMNGRVGLTKQQADPILGPAFSLLEVFITLLGDTPLSQHVPLVKEQFVMLSFVSSDFGFLPMQQLPGFLYAGHQDTLSESLSL